MLQLKLEDVSIVKDFIGFLISTTFIINFLVATAIVTAGVWWVFSRLDKITMHNTSITVPDFRGYELSEAEQLLVEKKLRFTVLDSVYDKHAKRGAIVDQNPEPEAKVKENRTVYFTVNSMEPPRVAMPNLKNLSKRQAIGVLKIVGLEVEKLTYRPDICVNCVLKQLYKDQPIEPGKLIRKGESIVLVLGQGQSNEKTSIPNLAGETIESAKIRLNDMSLNTGAIIFENASNKEDSIGSRVYKQLPAWSEDAEANLGSEISIWLTLDSSLWHLQNDSIPQDETP